MGIVTSLHRAYVATKSAVTAFADPERADAVAALGEVTGELALRTLRDKMLSDPVGRRLLDEKPVITSQSLGFDALADLPPASFGHQYHKFMTCRGSEHHVHRVEVAPVVTAAVRCRRFTPDERPELQFIDDEELGFVMLRYRQVHDFWHVLAGVQTDVLGELALKWFEMVHTGLPGPALASFVGPLRLSSADKKALASQYIPWAAHAAKECKFLLTVPYEDMLPLELDDVRRELRFTPAPTVTNSST